MEKTNLIELLHSAKIEDLSLPAPIFRKLQDQNLTDFLKIYSAVQVYRVFGKCSLVEFSNTEIDTINECFTALLASRGLMKRNDLPIREEPETKSSSPIPSLNHRATSSVVSRQAPTAVRNEPARKKTGAWYSTPPVNSTESAASSPRLPSPLSDWESRLAPQFEKVDWVGEIPVSTEELNDISLHLSRLFDNRPEQSILEFIERNYPVTFLVFMVGQGIYGYKSGDFWSAYEHVLRKSIDHAAFGRLFEILVQRFGKSQPNDWEMKSHRYVGLILAHGGITV
jgi:hypothetical protein